MKHSIIVKVHLLALLITVQVIVLEIPAPTQCDLSTVDLSIPHDSIAVGAETVCILNNGSTPQCKGYNNSATYGFKYIVPQQSWKALLILI